MRKEKGLSLLELLVVIAIIAMLLAIFMPPLGKVKTIAQRVVCGTNLKGLGTAMIVYGNDHDDKYPQLGKGTWAKKLGYSFDDGEYLPYDFEGPCTITSSLYLLVREADISPKSFVCPSSNQVEYDGTNTNRPPLDIVELWDFGPKPHDHVSYPYHNPYGRFSANGKRTAAFAIMADMSPWMKDGDFLSANSNKQLPPQIIDYKNMSTIRKGNSLHHNAEDAFLGTKYYDTGFGQNVLFADGHSSWERQPNVGVKYDNIYTYWSAEENPTEQDKQGGTAPTGRSPENDAKSEEDSFLVL